jgi:arylsulfatase A-like enzyme
MKVPGLVLALLSALPGCSDVPQFALPTRLDLLTDTAHVELLSGFAGRTSLLTWCDRSDPERDEVGLILERPATLLWHADVGPGRFLARVARLTTGSGDGQVTRLRVSVDGTPDTAVTVRVPAMSPATGKARATGRAGQGLGQTTPQREGPAAQLVLDLPAGASTLRIEALGAPGGDRLVLLSPRLELQPRRATLADHPLSWNDTESLLGRVPACVGEARTLFAQRREGAAGGTESVDVCPAESVTSFSGVPGRPALALTGVGASAEFLLSLRSDSTLAFALALDERLPQGSSARVGAWMDDELLGEWDVFRRTWTEIELPLVRYAGGTHRLELRLIEASLEPEWVSTTDIDFVRGIGVQAGYRAEQVRVGFANPRVMHPATAPRRARSDGPSVILVQVETTRADVLGPWGAAQPGVTPRLDALAKRSVVWETAIAPAPWTLPSTATLFTGLTPGAHGATDFDRVLLPPDVPTMAELARSSGVTTGAVVANWLLRDDTGFSRGFESYAHVPQVGAQQVNALARSFLVNNREQQFLLMLHYWDPHAEYAAPDAFRDRFVQADAPVGSAYRARGDAVARLAAGEDITSDDLDVRLAKQRYLGEIAWFDNQFGALIDMVGELGLSEDTVIVFTSDHGEEFGEHGFMGHGLQLFDESVHVPLMVHAPGGQWGPPRRIPGVVSTSGLFGAVLSTLGVGYETSTAHPALTRGAATGFAVTENHKAVTKGWSAGMQRELLTAVRTDEHLLLRRSERDDPDSSVRFEFYDLVNDPGARTALPPLGESFTRLTRLLDEARAWNTSHAANRPSAGGDDVQLEGLRAIGYVGDDTR